ncbi:MAG: hypothetical protein M3431_02430 [Actinomycetota bacterium]|nr:hypothetical protein [Actinomycetota bacterium]
MRETAVERVLVHAARAAHESLTVRRGDLGLAGDVECVYGDGTLTVTEGVVTLPGDGPAITVWRIG